MNLPFYHIFLFAILPCFLVLDSSQSDDAISQFQTSNFGNDVTPAYHYCEQASYQESIFIEYPELRKKHQAWEQQMLQRAEVRTEVRSKESSQAHQKMNYVLPIVVHVIHDNGPENITDLEIETGIQNINDAFANLGYYDQGTGVNTQIEFCLATRDSDGNATSGINRIQSSLTEMFKTDDLEVKNLSRWDPESYINIWLVKEICSVNGCGVAGYANLPSSHGTEKDGIVMEARWFGSSKSNSTIGVHELGHYLGLYHTFYGGCTNENCQSDGDKVCDTPPDQSTAPVPCSGYANSCHTDVNTDDDNNPFTVDENDLFINYMDYGDRDCYSMMTLGQTTRMQDAIETARASLLQSKGCQPPCLSPISASFEISADSIIVGNSATFLNTSSNATSYQWTINGVPFNGSTYLFEQDGNFIINLFATNSDPNCSADYSDTITVLCNVDAEFTVPATIITAGDSLSFTNTSSNATDYQWSINGVQQVGSPDLQYTFTQSGLYTISLSAIGVYCQDVQTMLITVESSGACVTVGAEVNYSYPNYDVYTRKPQQFPDGSMLINSRLPFTLDLVNRVSKEGVSLWKKEFNHPTQGVWDPAVLIDGSVAFSRFDHKIFGLDPSGNLTWAYDVNLTEIVNSLQFLPLENEYMFCAGDSRDVHLWKIGVDGSISWSKVLEFNNNIYFAYDMNNYSFTNNSIWLFAQRSGNNIDFENVLLKIDSNGELLYAQGFQDDFSQNQHQQELEIDYSSSSVVVSWAEGNVNDPDRFLYIMKKDDAGNTIWSKKIPGQGQSISGLDLRPDGGVVAIFTVFATSSQVMAFSSNGDVEYLQNIPASKRVVDFTYINGQPMAVILIQGSRVRNLSPVDAQWAVIHPCNEATFTYPTIPNYPVNHRTITPVIAANTISLIPTTIDIKEGIEVEKKIICAPNYCPEICDNQIDDDGDGLIDCNDPDCCNDISCENEVTPCDPCSFDGILNLGPDIAVCDNGIYNFNAGNGFESYLWSDNTTDSTFTSDGDGLFWVEAIDSCGNIHRDSVSITYNSSSQLDLGTDTIICIGDTLILGANQFDHYQWFSDTPLTCDTCSAITIQPDSSRRYILLASTNTGCYSIDTINVIVDSPSILLDTAKVCAGEVFSIDGLQILSDTTVHQTFSFSQGCDSTYSLTVVFNELLTTSAEFNLCEGESVEVFGQLISENAELEQTFTSATGCDSTHSVSVFFNEQIETSAEFNLCEGESVEVFGQVISENAELEQTFTSATGCDSTHSVSVVFSEQIETSAEFNLCEGESVEVFGQLISENAELAQTFTSASGCDSTHSVSVFFSGQVETSAEFNLCEGESVEVFGQVISENAELEQTFTSASGCDSTHSVSVTFQQDVIFTDSVKLCFNDFVLFFGDSIFQAGTYQQLLNPLSEGCDTLQLLNVEMIPLPEIQAVGIAACPAENNGQLIIQNTDDFESFSIDGISYQSSPIFDQLPAGEHLIYVQDHQGCIVEEFFEISTIAPLINQHSDSILIFQDEIIVVPIEYNYPTEELTFEWTPSLGLSCTTCPNPTFDASFSQEYTLTVSDFQECTETISLIIIVDQENNIYIPNAFSPNGDNKNDQLVVFGNENIEEILLFRIYSRWGELVFEQSSFPVNSVEHSWDGKFVGKEMNPGIFLYTLEAITKSGKSIMLTGDVTLMR